MIAEMLDGAVFVSPSPGFGHADAVLALVLAGVNGVDPGAPPDVLGPRLAAVYAVAVPPLLAFLAGWIAARTSWFTRVVVVGVAVLALAALPYAALGAATATALTG